MKSIGNSFIIACSMYSKIPMPKVEWSKENMKYVMCFFPLIGLFIGGVIYGFYELQLYLSLTPVLSAIIFVLIPILVTGGIHMDGLMDTVDALSSYQTKERKLEILKDPHTGAFAVMACMCYLLLTFGVWYQISMKPLWILGLGFVLSRAMSGFAIVTFPLANPDVAPKTLERAAILRNDLRPTVVARARAVEFSMLMPPFSYIADL